MVTNRTDYLINAFNSKLADAYAKFINALEDVRRITPAEEEYLLEERTAQIDNAYCSIVTAYRPHLRRFIEKSIPLQTVNSEKNND